MSQPYIGEIRMFAGNFAPYGWLFCDGSILPISENDTLFALIGTTYGGDGQSTFALPDMRGRLPIHQGGGFVLAQNGGAEQVTVTVNQMSAHSHPLLGSADAGGDPNPTNSYLASTATGEKVYTPSGPSVQMRPNTVSSVGGSQPHSNMQPYLCVNFIIAEFGIFPSPS